MGHSFRLAGLCFALRTIAVYKADLNKAAEDALAFARGRLTSSDPPNYLSDSLLFRRAIIRYGQFLASATPEQLDEEWSKVREDSSIPVRARRGDLPVTHTNPHVHRDRPAQVKFQEVPLENPNV